MKSLVFMYSGQGSQYYNMGRDLYVNCREFRENLEKLDSFFYELTGDSVLHHVFATNRKKAEPFKRMLYTHSGIYMLEYCLTTMLVRDGIMPDFYLGASLGEITATSLAANIEPRKVISLLVQQSLVCEKKLCESSMIAILENSFQLEKIQEQFPLIDIAAINYSEHYVVSGSYDVMKQLLIYLKANSLSHSAVSVPFAYHSRIFDDIKSDIDSSKLLNNSVLRVPCISCSEIKILKRTYKGLLWNIIRKPIHFYETLKNFDRLGSFTYLDVGPSGTLSNYVRHILYESGSNSKSFQIMSPYTDDYEKYSEINNIFKLRSTR